MADQWGNYWKRFDNLNPGGALMLGEVLSQEDGYSWVQILGSGSVMRVKGAGVAVGHRAFIRDNAVEGEAPMLSVVEIEV
ncbi:conserved hypothetical protein [Gammaproteobacteria bacterium]